jgi:hypothetical protein
MMQQITTVLGSAEYKHSRFPLIMKAAYAVPVKNINPKSSSNPCQPNKCYGTEQARDRERINADI